MYLYQRMFIKRLLCSHDYKRHRTPLKFGEKFAIKEVTKCKKCGKVLKTQYW